VGPRAGLDKCGKSRSHRDSIPGPYNPYPVAIPTELLGSQLKELNLYNTHSFLFQGLNSGMHAGPRFSLDAVFAKRLGPLPPPLSLLFNGHQVLFSWGGGEVKRSECEANHLYLKPRLRRNGTTPSGPNTNSGRAEGQGYFYCHL
jgi:hypothetical protein